MMSNSALGQPKSAASSSTLGTFPIGLIDDLCKFTLRLEIVSKMRRMHLRFFTDSSLVLSIKKESSANWMRGMEEPSILGEKPCNKPVESTLAVILICSC